MNPFRCVARFFKDLSAAFGPPPMVDWASVLCDHPIPPGPTLPDDLAGILHDWAALREDYMTLSTRAQAIVDRVTAFSNNLQAKIVADEAAHDAANAAANDADDSAIEGAMTTLEGSLAAPATGGETLPPAT